MHPQVIKSAGRLQHFLDKWQQITSDEVILSWVKGFKIPFSCRVYQNEPLITRPHNAEEDKCFLREIHELILKGVIHECSPCRNQFVSKIFLLDKSNGEKRMILNLKDLNKFIDTAHFKLEDLRTAIKLLSNNYYMCCVDLKDAYYAISVDKNHRKYLRFQYNSKLYEYSVLPMGLNVAPYVFTKLMKPVMQHLRGQGYLSVIYLDDALLLAESYTKCKQNMTDTIALFESLGFIVNYDKSQLMPQRTCKFLGFILNSKNLTIALPENKRLLIKSELLKFKKLKVCTVRSFARMIGLLCSACPAITYGWAHTKLFERVKYLKLKGNEDYEQRVVIPKHLQVDFKWWIDNIDCSINFIRDHKYVREIYSDSCLSGWGAACGDKRANGFWSVDETNKHINELELIAAYFALKIFGKHIYNSQLLLRIDNTTAIAYINRMGGIQYPHLNKVARDIWDWCEARNNFVFASYIKSADNSIADFESRRLNDDTEWQLNNMVYNGIVNRLSVPEIDLFASRLNHKCEKYVSWHGDPNSFAIDAFTLNWKCYFFYAFPPFCLILKVLSKIVQEKARGIVLVPNWPNQPWYPLYHRLLDSELIVLDANPRLLSSPYRALHPLHKSLSLMAGILCGKRS